MSIIGLDPRPAEPRQENPEGPRGEAPSLLARIGYSIKDELQYNIAAPIKKAFQEHPFISSFAAYVIALSFMAGSIFLYQAEQYEKSEQPSYSQQFQDYDSGQGIESILLQ
ncbi:MAG TPA: hypothetical protein VJB08_03830 [Candidatus Nanoarchaeia archaeon]|nr:hypothetical protein [Candidatus Nanoarchaeia archaeon]